MLLSSQRADEVPTQIDLKKEGMALKLGEKIKLTQKKLYFFATN